MYCADMLYAHASPLAVDGKRRWLENILGFHGRWTLRKSVRGIELCNFVFDEGCDYFGGYVRAMDRPFCCNRTCRAPSWLISCCPSSPLAQPRHLVSWDSWAYVRAVNRLSYCIRTCRASSYCSSCSPFKLTPRTAIVQVEHRRTWSHAFLQAHSPSIATW